MTVRQWLIAGVRTGIQRLVAVGIGALAGYLASKGLVVELDPGAWMIAIDPLVTGAVTVGVIAAEDKWPVLRKITSLGLSKSGPEYIVK